MTMKRRKTAGLLRTTLLCAALLAFMPARAQDASQAATPTVPDLVETAFQFADFAELERLYATYGAAGVRSPLTGTPRVKHFWMGIGKFADSTLNVSEEYYAQLDALTAQWAREHPQSVLAQLLYADSLMTHAWVFRGQGYANTVSPASWEAFGKYLNLALEQLRRSEKLAAKDSSWNSLMLRVGRGLGWRVDQLLPVFEAGIAKNPDHDDLYFAMQTSLLPRWGGDLEAVDRYIAWVTQTTKDKRGMEMYARLYAAVSATELEQALFTSSRASWPKMKAGFEDLLSRYPYVDHHNRYAYFACMAKDRPALQQQLDLIGNGFNAIFWGNSPEKTFQECKAFANQL